MLSEKITEKVLQAALETGGDFAEIFVEDKTNTSLNMIGGIVEKALSGRDFGIGIRIFKGFFSVYAYTNDGSEENLIKVARSASKAIQGDGQGRIFDVIQSIPIYLQAFISWLAMRNKRQQAENMISHYEILAN